MARILTIVSVTLLLLVTAVNFISCRPARTISAQARVVLHKEGDVSEDIITSNRAHRTFKLLQTGAVTTNPNDGALLKHGHDDKHSTAHSKLGAGLALSQADSDESEEDVNETLVGDADLKGDAEAQKKSSDQNSEDVETHDQENEADAENTTEKGEQQVTEVGGSREVSKDAQQQPEQETSEDAQQQPEKETSEDAQQQPEKETSEDAQQQPEKETSEDDQQQPEKETSEDAQQQPEKETSEDAQQQAGEEESAEDPDEEQKDGAPADHHEATVMKAITDLVGNVSSDNLSDSLKEHVSHATANTTDGETPATGQQASQATEAEQVTGTASKADDTQQAQAGAEDQAKIAGAQTSGSATPSATGSTNTQGSETSKTESNAAAGTLSVTEPQTGQAGPVDHSQLEREDENGVNSAVRPAVNPVKERSVIQTDVDEMQSAGGVPQDGDKASNAEEHAELDGNEDDEAANTDDALGTVDNGADDGNAVDKDGDKVQTVQADGKVESKGGDASEKTSAGTDDAADGETEVGTQSQSGQTKSHSGSRKEGGDASRGEDELEEEEEEIADELGTVDGGVDAQGQDGRVQEGNTQQKLDAAHGDAEEQEGKSNSAAAGGTSSDAKAGESTTTADSGHTATAEATETANDKQTAATTGAKEADTSAATQATGAVAVDATTSSADDDDAKTDGTSAAKEERSEDNNEEAEDEDGSHQAAGASPPAATAQTTTANSEVKSDMYTYVKPDAGSVAAGSPSTAGSVIHPTLTSQFEAGSGAAAKPETGSHTTGSISSGALHPDTLNGQVTSMLPVKSTADPTNPDKTVTNTLIDKLIDKPRSVIPPSAHTVFNGSSKSSTDAGPNTVFDAVETEDIDDEQAGDAVSPKSAVHNAAAHDGVALVSTAGLADDAAVELADASGDVTVPGSQPGVAHLPGQAFGNFEADTHKQKKSAVAEVEATWLMRHTDKLWVLATLVIIGALGLLGMVAWRQLASGRRLLVKGPIGGGAYAPVASREQLSSKSNDSSSSWNDDWDVEEDEESQDWGSGSGKGPGSGNGLTRAMKLGSHSNVAGVSHRSTKG